MRPHAAESMGEFEAALRTLAPQTAVVLGSGLGAIVDRIEVASSLPFARVPTLPAATVQGHGGQILLGRWAGAAVLVYAGRVHFYEGNTWDQVVEPVRLAAAWGVRRLLLTNAAGGIGGGLVPGSLMALRGHLDWTRPRPWERTAFVEAPYAAGLRRALADSALEAACSLAEGIYAALLGPNYETPAEIRALRTLGADAVGMSTAREAEAAHALGMECAAVSCITNLAAGLSAVKLTHEEVLETSKQQSVRLGRVLEGCLARLSSPASGR